MRLKILAAFAAVYIIWGSTYIAILFAIETLPPFLMAGTRFLTAGALLFGWSMARSRYRPSGREWAASAVIGTLLLMGGNGAVVWAEQVVPSGVAALLIAVTPGWMALLDWLWAKNGPPARRTVFGLILGFGGLALLVGPESIVGGGAVNPIGALVLVFGSLSWATGSIYSRSAPQPASPALSTGMQMLTGGTVLVLAGSVTGEFAELDIAAVSTRSLLAVLYLIFFGSVVGYSAYIWLLRVVSAARVSTYAYVNPVVAVLLGWALAGEALTPRMGMAAAVIIAGVAMITLGGARRSPAEPGARTPAPSPDATRRPR